MSYKMIFFYTILVICAETFMVPKLNYQVHTSQNVKNVNDF